MRWVFKFLSMITALGFSCANLEGQGGLSGTLMFSNQLPLGGPSFPFTAGGTLIGPDSEYYAELYRESGQLIGGPVGFVDGIFNGGIVQLPGGGSVSNLVVKVSDDDGVVWESGVLRVSVGQWSPLVGIEAVDILNPPCDRYRWTASIEGEKNRFAPVRCVCVRDGVETEVERQLCEGRPMSRSFLQVEIQRVSADLLKIKWFRNVDFILVESDRLSSEAVISRTPEGVGDDGKNFILTKPTGAAKFYWLAPIDSPSD